MCRRPFSLFGLDFLADSHTDKISLSLFLSFYALCPCVSSSSSLGTNANNPSLSVCVCVCVFVSIQQRESSRTKYISEDTHKKIESVFSFPKTFSSKKKTVVYVYVITFASSELSRDFVASKREGGANNTNTNKKKKNDDDRERGGGDDGGGGGGEARGHDDAEFVRAFVGSRFVVKIISSRTKGDENARMDRMAETEQNETRGRHIVLAEKEHADNVHALGGIHRPEETRGEYIRGKR